MRRTSSMAVGALLALLPLAATDAGASSPPDRMIVRLEPGASIQAFINLCEAQHPEIDLQVVAADDAAVHYLLGFDATGLTPQQLAALESSLQGYEDDGLLGWGELDHGADAPETDSGGTTGDVWFYVGDGAPQYAIQYAVQNLGLNAAHTVSTGSTVVVAVLDTGVDATHPALQGRVLGSGFNFVDNSADTSDLGDGLDNDGDGTIDELTGHGTFVASLVHLVAPSAMILPIRVLDSDGRGTSWAITEGINYAVAHGAEIINLSLGSIQKSDSVEEAMKSAAQQGIVVVAAAGNLNTNDPEFFPATHDPAIGVAAVDSHDLKAPFSSFNEDIAIAAPGASTGPAGGFDPATSIVGALPGGQYGISQGTSFSSALVAGAAALVRAQHPGWPSGTMTPADIPPAIRSVLVSTAVPIDALNGAYAGELGAGRLDVAAVDAADLMILLGNWG